MKSIKTFSILFENKMVPCCVTSFKNETHIWTINLPDHVVELTCEPDKNLTIHWYINGQSSPFSQALGAAIMAAKK